MYERFALRGTGQMQTARFAGTTRQYEPSASRGTRQMHEAFTFVWNDTDERGELFAGNYSWGIAK